MARVRWQTAANARNDFGGVRRGLVKVDDTGVDGHLETIIQSGEGLRIMKVFMKIVNERFQRSIRRHDIGHEGDLSESLKSRAWQQGGTLGGRTTFNFYGRFVDMGVGNGVTLSEASSGVSLTSTRKGYRRKRRAKKWYSSTLAHESSQLAKVFASAQAGQLAQQTAAQLRNSIEIQL